MKTSDEILSEIKGIFTAQWGFRDGQKVPDPEDVGLGNDGVRLEASVLYADMADSTGLVNGYKDWFAAEVYKSYLAGACHVIRNNSGFITAFDGDRIMAVYVGNTKNSSAVKTALQLNWLVTKINAQLVKSYPNSAFRLKHHVGVDSGGLLVARTGARSANDLVWVGAAANLAAKLACSGVGAESIVITDRVFNMLREDCKNGGSPKACMWTKGHWEERNTTVYYSGWEWAVP
jgi:class 3 adenylate cyclase